MGRVGPRPLEHVSEVTSCGAERPLHDAALIGRLFGVLEMTSQEAETATATDAQSERAHANGRANHLPVDTLSRDNPGVG